MRFWKIAKYERHLVENCIIMFAMPFRFRVHGGSSRSTQSLGPLFKAQYGRNWRNMGMGMGHFGEKPDEDEWNPVDNTVPDIHRGHLSPHQWQFIHMNDSSSGNHSGSNDHGGDFVPEADDDSGMLYSLVQQNRIVCSYILYW